ncbi:MAG: sodium:proton antiporter [Clostridia bacterium]|nr:sodium:proton antiporter [Clostridia bacterium]
MPEIISFGLFTAGLVISLVADISVIWPLLFGLAVFFGYGLYKKHNFASLVKMSWSGVKTTANILLVFTMIGALTAVWRASGTIPYVVYYATKFISPHVFLPAAFLLCCGLSLLLGTSFGTCATLGVICMAMGKTMGVSSFWLGGAILAGAFFGDRSSPMSTSALLVSTLTRTNIYKNIANMLKSAVIPFVLTCSIFLCAGLFGSASDAPVSSAELFAQHFSLSWICLLPAAAVILLSVFRVNVKITIIVSIVVGSAVCMTAQNTGFAEILKTLVTGYTADDKQLSAMLSGGGLVSMLLPAAIVCISSCYTGIFDGTGMLESTKGLVSRLADKITPTGSMVVTSIFTSVISCNQTLAIMLSHQLGKDAFPDDYDCALALENSAVVISPLVPWSIAGAVPLAVLGAPVLSLVFAFYLYLVPLSAWLTALIARRRRVPVNN